MCDKLVFPIRAPAKQIITLSSWGGVTCRSNSLPLPLPRRRSCNFDADLGPITSANSRHISALTEGTSKSLKETRALILARMVTNRVAPTSSILFLLRLRCCKRISYCLKILKQSIHPDEEMFLFPAMSNVTSELFSPKANATASAPSSLISHSEILSSSSEQLGNPSPSENPRHPTCVIPSLPRRLRRFIMRLVANESPKEIAPASPTWLKCASILSNEQDE